MAIQSSTLAWKIPWTEEPNRPQSMGSKRVGHDWVTSLHSLHFRKLLQTIMASIRYMTCLGVTWLLIALPVIYHSTAFDFLLLFFFDFLLLETLWSLVCGILLLFYLILLSPLLNSCLLEDVPWPPTKYIVLTPLDLYLVICLLFVTLTIHSPSTRRWRILPILPIFAVPTKVPGTKEALNKYADWMHA